MLLQQLETFCRVVDEQSFTKAAEGLGFSQPTVTKQVQNLEEELGSLLLERKRRSVELTPAGELVYSYARHILNTLSECRLALENLRTPGQGTLSIGTVFTIALFTLPPVLEEYREGHPGVTVRVQTGSNQAVLSMVLRNEADVGLTSVPLSHPQVQTIPLFEDPVILVSSPSAPWASAEPIEPSALVELPMVSYARNSQFRAFVDAHFEGRGIRPNTVMEFDSHEAVKTMVQLGLGVAMVPESAVKDDLRAGRLVVLEINGFPKLERVTSLLVRQDRHVTKAMESFIDLCLARLRTILHEPG